MTEMCTRFDLGTLERPRPLAAAHRRRVRPRHARPGVLRRARALGRRRRGDACGSTSSSPTATRSASAARTAATSSGATGDWSDFSTQFMAMTESMLVTAQLAYVYPRLAELADARGDTAFAARAARRRRGAARGARPRVDRQGLVLARLQPTSTRSASGAIYGEPQPWALLGGAPSREQSATLVGNIRRFLTGVGAPPEVKGPAKIGSSQSPAANDPDVTEYDADLAARRSNNAVYVGGAWYAVNGWLTWALGELDGVVPNAREYALDELERNTLAAHATRLPRPLVGRDLGRRRVQRALRGRPVAVRRRDRQRRLQHADHAPARVEPVRRDQARRHRPRRATATGSTRTCR